MPFVFLRLLSWAVGLSALLLSWWQWRVPQLYPWPLLAGVFLHASAACLLVSRSRTWKTALLFLTPSFFVMGVIGFGHVLIESPGLRWLTTGLYAFLPWLALELAWSLLYDARHYPLHGLARLNIVALLIGMWYVQMSLHGIQVLLQLVPVWVLASIALGYCVLAFFTTTTAWRAPPERRWLAASVLVGTHVGILLLVLPTSMIVHGSLAALLLALPLRLRSWSTQAPPHATIALEGAVLAVLWLAVLFSARWV